MWDRDDCDCFNEEVDVIEGYAWCPDCGSRRYLTSQQISERLALEAELQEEYDRQCSEWDKERASGR